VQIKKSSIIFSAVNLIGLFFCCLFVANICLQARLEQRDYYEFGDSLYFTLTALPVFFLCLFVDVVWAILAVVAIYRRRDYQSAAACGVVAAIWMLTILLVRHMT
jgi:uncharacterized membrane protein